MGITYHNILVAVDGSEESDCAFEKAINIAERNEAKLIITHVVDNRSFTLAETAYANNFTEHAMYYAKELLSSYEKKAKEAGFSNFELLVEFGSPKVLIAKEIAPVHNVDLIVCGATGLGAVERFIMGSVAESIIRYSKCDVLVVRSNEQKDKGLKDKTVN